MDEQDRITAHVKSVIDDVKSTLLFEDDATNQAINLKTMDPRDPDNSVLRNFGTLFIIASTRRLNDTFLPGAEIVSSLAAYERLALEIGFDSDELLNIHQQNIAKSICLYMGNLQELIREGGDKGRKCLQLGIGIAQVFGTYYAGMEACNERASLVGRGLVIMLATCPPFSSWKSVFTRAVQAENARRTQEPYNEEGRSTTNESAASSEHSGISVDSKLNSSGGDTQNSEAIHRTCSATVNPADSVAGRPRAPGSAGAGMGSEGTVTKFTDGTASEDPRAAVGAFQTKLEGLTQDLNDALDRLSIELKGSAADGSSGK